MVRRRLLTADERANFVNPWPILFLGLGVVGVVAAIPVALVASLVHPPGRTQYALAGATTAIGCGIMAAIATTWVSVTVVWFVGMIGLGCGHVLRLRHTDAVRTYVAMIYVSPVLLALVLLAGG